MQTTDIPIRSSFSPIVRGEKSPLAAALARCQAAGKPVPADATNQQFGYKYPSSESVIQAGKDALAVGKLSLLPIQQVIVPLDAGCPGPALRCTFLLLHEDGENVACVREVPICIDKRKGGDKAVSAASTLCLSYLLRDLLLLPRPGAVDDQSSEVQRDEPQEARSGQAAPRPPRPKKEKGNGRDLPVGGAELEARLLACEQGLVKQGVCQPGALIAYVRASMQVQDLGVDIVKLPPVHYAVMSDMVGSWIKAQVALKASQELPAPVPG